MRIEHGRGLPAAAFSGAVADLRRVGFGGPVLETLPCNREDNPTNEPEKMRAYCVQVVT